MAGYMIAEIWCDNCYERQQIEDQGTLTELRANLREEGWCCHRANGPLKNREGDLYIFPAQDLADFCSTGCCPIHGERELL